MLIILFQVLIVISHSIFVLFLSIMFITYPDGDTFGKLLISFILGGSIFIIWSLQYILFNELKPYALFKGNT